MPKRNAAILLASVFLVAGCALVYELIAGAVSSYLLGSSITQFSLVIGIFLTAMGIGSYLTRFFQDRLVTRFIQIEVAIGLLGGFSALLLFLAFAYTEIYFTVMLAVSGGIGTLIGLEIPLIIRILRGREESLRLTVANVMTVDYVGALAASLAFPFLLVPHLGLMRASFATGLLNLAVAGIGLMVFREEIADRKRLCAVAASAAMLLLSGVLYSATLVSLVEERIYPDEIVYARQTPYQKIVVTHWREDTRLFLDGSLQFSSVDEHRYHETLAHPAMSLSVNPRRILILGGGDGMAARECLKYPEVSRIDLVDIDPEMTRIFAELPFLAKLNKGSLRNPKVHIHNLDALVYLEKTDQRYDVIISDLPDPSILSLGRLYTLSFYALATRRLAENGIISVQSTSPFFAPDAFWCIVNTLDATPVSANGPGKTLNVAPCQITVPSFGVWGFALASAAGLAPEQAELRVETRYLTNAMLKQIFTFPADMQPRATEINRLDNQILVQYYTHGYRQFYD